jgi:ribonuclease BN (tRNA processing enzyme)
MCQSCYSPIIEHPASRPSRRGLMAGGITGLAAGALFGSTGTAAADTSAPKARVGARSLSKGMHVVTLGTMGGPPPVVDRAGISTAVLVDGTVYLVDAGRAAVTQYTRSGLPFANLAAMFITHLHADHVADYFNFFLLGGLYNPQQHDTLAGPIPVYGPGPAGGLPPTFGGGTSPTTNPDNPTPGLLSFTDDSANAFAYSTNVFMRDSLIRETRSLADVHEVVIPDVGANYQNRAPAMTPFVVMEDERIRVTAVLVPHGPVFPAFAYRFDSDHGSVTLSGDTTYSSNLVALASNTDILVHEAINIRGWDGPPALKNHLLESHVEVQKVGGIAEAARAKALVLSHMGDFTSEFIDTKVWSRLAQQGYGGRVSVGADLHSYRVS